MAKNKEKTKNPLMKYRLYLFLLVVIITFTILNLNASSLPVTDNMALQTLENNYKATGRESQIGTEQFQQEAEALSEQYKTIYQNKDGNTYLYGVDSYRYLREAKGILEGGKADSMLPYLEAYSYRLFRIFNSNMSLMQAAFWLPFIFTLLSIILMFFIGRQLTNDLGGFFAALILAVHPQFFTATQAGFADTNFLNLFSSLFVVLLFVKGIDFNQKGRTLEEKARSNIKQIILLVLILPVCYLFSFAWKGYFYIIFVILVSLFIYLLHYLYTQQKDKKSRTASKYRKILIAVIIILFVGIFLARDVGFVKEKTDLVKARLGLTDTSTFFPSSASTTTELLSASEAQTARGNSQSAFIYLMNGWILAILAIYSIFILIKHSLKLNKKTKYSIFALVWFFAMFYAGYSSIRFISFFGPAFALVVSCGLVDLYSIAEKKLVKRYKYKKSMVFVALIIVFLLLVIVPIKADLSRRAERTPIMTSIIERTGDNLKQTPENAIINLWWDKGYFYEYFSEREVSMNNGVGGTADPRIYWTARLFMSKQEEEAMQIIKMLDCDFSHTYIVNPNINFSKFDCDLPSSYLLLDNGLIAKLAIFDYYVKWKFREENKPYSEPEIPLISRPTGCFPNADKTHLICGQNFDIDMKSGSLTYKGEGYPLVMVGDDTVYYSDDKGPYSLLVYPINYGSSWVYKSVLLDSELLDTMFVKLYFMKGIGMEHFEVFSEIADPVMGRVVVYKVLNDI